MSLLAPARVAFATERLNDALWAEFVPLWVQHYDECALDKDIPLQPVRATYDRIQANGCLRIYTARTAAGALIGYCIYFVAVNAHYGSLTQANQDLLYVDQYYRGSRIGVELIRYTHNELRAEGVRVVTQHSKGGKLDLGPMLKRLLGYREHDIIYSKRLDKDD